jgi:hypothetical protein
VGPICDCQRSVEKEFLGDQGHVLGNRRATVSDVTSYRLYANAAMGGRVASQ